MVYKRVMSALIFLVDLKFNSVFSSLSFSPPAKLDYVNEKVCTYPR
jgi:hypothetical protein